MLGRISRLSTRSKVIAVVLIPTTTAVVYYQFKPSTKKNFTLEESLDSLSGEEKKARSETFKIPSRSDIITQLQAGEEFDVLIIGGGDSHILHMYILTYIYNIHKFTHKLI
jgi:NAD kinase